MKIHQDQIIKTVQVCAALLCVAPVISFSSCDSNDGPSEEDTFLKKLGYEWKLTAGTVTVDGVDVTEAFAGMVATFRTDKTYSVSNGSSPIWPAQGSFELVNKHNGVFDLRRDDGVQITVTALTDTGVTLRFQYTSPGGRARSVSGQYEFVLNR